MLMRSLPIILCFTAGTLALAAGCDNDDDSNNRGPDLAAAADAGGGRDLGSARVSESDIAAILDAVNTGEVMQAQTAQSQGLTTTDAQQFAAMMISMHGAAKARQDTLFAQLQITPTPNERSQQLMADSAHVETLLTRLSGPPLDQGYIDSQVTGHQNVLDLLDLLLIPSASTAQLVTELTATRATVKMHLDLAKEIQRHLVGLD
jgi:putative membrane protein